MQSAQLDKFSNFVNALEEHQQACDNFFSIELLDLLATHFGYSNSAITAYDNGSFLGAIGYSKVAKVEDYYVKYFRKRDVLSQYVNSHQYELLKSPVPIVRSTEVIAPNEYIGSEYIQFLNRMELRYSAVLLFQDFRIILYKSVDAGDFTEFELIALTSIYGLINMKYKIFVTNRMKQISNETMNSYLDNIKTGILVFDDTGNIMEYNQCGIKFSMQLFNIKSISQLFSRYLDLINNSQNNSETSSTLYFKEYEITTDKIAKVTNFGLIKSYYFIKIKKLVRNRILETKALEQFNTLSQREFEVLNAFCDGEAYQDIANSLYISENTVRSHLKNIYRKLNIKNQRSLIKLYTQYSLSMN